MIRLPWADSRHPVFPRPRPEPETTFGESQTG